MLTIALQFAALGHMELVAYKSAVSPVLDLTMPVTMLLETVMKDVILDTGETNVGNIAAPVVQDRQMLVMM